MTKNKVWEAVTNPLNTPYPEGIAIYIYDAPEQIIVRPGDTIEITVEKVPETENLCRVMATRISDHTSQRKSERTGNHFTLYVGSSTNTPKSDRIARTPFPGSGPVTHSTL